MRAGDTARGLPVPDATTHNPCAVTAAVPCAATSRDTDPVGGVALTTGGWWKVEVPGDHNVGCDKVLWAFLSLSSWFLVVSMSVGGKIRKKG
jgi:hypothetical protein